MLFWSEVEEEVKEGCMLSWPQKPQKGLICEQDKPRGVDKILLKDVENMQQDAEYDKLYPPTRRDSERVDCYKFNSARLLGVIFEASQQVSPRRAGTDLEVVCC